MTKRLLFFAFFMTGDVMLGILLWALVVNLLYATIRSARAD